jgi:hypothetical protein
MGFFKDSSATPANIGIALIAGTAAILIGLLAYQPTIAHSEPHSDDFFHRARKSINDATPDSLKPHQETFFEKARKSASKAIDNATPNSLKPHQETFFETLRDRVNDVSESVQSSVQSGVKSVHDAVMPVADSIQSGAHDISTSAHDAVVPTPQPIVERVIDATKKFFSRAPSDFTGEADESLLD